MPRIVHVLAFDNAQVLDVTGPLQVFASTNDLARQRGWEGTVEVALKMSAPSLVPEVTLVSSSGHGVLDEQAVAMLTHAAQRILEQGRRRCPDGAAPIAVGTVHRAIRCLRRQTMRRQVTPGLQEFRQKRGSFVCGQPVAQKQRQQQEQ